MEALLSLDDAELALGRHAAAGQAFEQARNLALGFQNGCRHEAAAGLARVARVQGDVAAALRELESMLGQGASACTLDGAGMPRLVELTCHRVLAESNDYRAAEWLARAHNALQVQAAAIPEGAQREGCLQNIPHHREIVALWGARNDSVR